MFGERVITQHLWVKLGVLEMDKEGDWKGCVRGDLKDRLQRVLTDVLRSGVSGVNVGLWVVQGMFSHAAEDFGGSSGASVGLG